MQFIIYGEYVKRFDYDSFVLYFNKKYVKNKNKEIQIRDNIIKNIDAVSKQKNSEIQNLYNQNNIQKQVIEDYKILDYIELEGY